MAGKVSGLGIEPRTEYARTRVRCRRCGEAVPRATSQDARCRRCVAEVAE